MKELQQTKIKVLIAPGAIVDDSDFLSNVIDLSDFEGCDYIEILGVLGPIDATMAVLKVMESAVKATATALGGTPALVVDAPEKPTASMDNRPFVFGIDLRGPRERYLHLQAESGDGVAGTYLTASAIGRRGTIGSSDAADRGLLFAAYA